MSKKDRVESHGHQFIIRIGERELLYPDGVVRPEASNQDRRKTYPSRGEAEAKYIQWKMNS